MLKCNSMKRNMYFSRIWRETWINDQLDGIFYTEYRRGHHQQQPILLETKAHFASQLYVIHASFPSRLNEIIY